MKTKLATLTDVEDRFWVDTFNACIEEGLSDIQADKRTWQELKKEFPRLKNYRGCKQTVIDLNSH